MNTTYALPTHIVDSHFIARISDVVIALRREGYAAWSEGIDGITTNAPRAVVNMAAGHGLFLTFTTGQSR